MSAVRLVLYPESVCCQVKDSINFVLFHYVLCGMVLSPVCVCFGHIKESKNSTSFTVSAVGLVLSLKCVCCGHIKDSIQFVFFHYICCESGSFS